MSSVSSFQRTEASIVVPTLDRPALLARCLAALARQVDVDPLEVIVVDAGSRDIDAVVEAVGAVAGTRLVRSEQLSPAAARNAGIASALGSYVLFTDDDCVPAPEWASRLLAHLRAEADVVAGPSINGRERSSLAAATQVVLDYVTDPSTARQGKTFVTMTNLGCRREVAVEIPFDERFPFASEDRDWCARVSALGHTIAFATDALVVHDHEATLRGFVRKHFAYGQGAYRFRKKHGAESWGESPTFYLELLRNGFARGPATGAAVAVAQAVTGLGFVGAAVVDLAPTDSAAGARRR